MVLVVAGPAEVWVKSACWPFVSASVSLVLAEEVGVGSWLMALLVTESIHHTILCAVLFFILKLKNHCNPCHLSGDIATI